MEEIETIAKPPITDDELLANFPFTPRGNQQWLLDQLLPLLNDPLKKFIIIQAPTGSGKSAIAVAASLSCSRSHVLTANKFLQDQYERDFSHLMDSLKGRANYSCSVKTGEHCGNDVCRKLSYQKRKADGLELCDYHKAVEEASMGQTSLMNFSAGVAFLNYTPYFKDKREMLVIDEAHMLEGQLTSFVEFVLEEKDLIDLGLLDPGRYIPQADSPELYISFLKGLKLSGEVALAKKSLSGDRSDRVQAHVRKLELLIQDLLDNPGNVILTKEVDHKGYIPRIRFQPLYVGKHAASLVFDHADKVIMLSATILNLKGYCKSLGIPLDQVTYIDVPSTFPKENRPIVCPIVGDFNMGNLKQHTPMICRVINHLMTKMHHKDKGIIHVPSYALAQEIYDSLPQLHDRLLFPRKASDQQMTIMLHEVENKPTVLLSPSMSEGVDLKDDLSRFQIIVKVPYPSLGDKLVKERMNRDSSWYPTQTLLKLVQSYGRSVRSETDHATTYVLDGNFHKLVDQNRSILPKWFLEAVT